MELLIGKLKNAFNKYTYKKVVTITILGFLTSILVNGIFVGATKH